MLATPIIIAIAVGAGLVALCAIGAGIHVHLQRKRTRTYLNTLSQDLAAYHRTRLSAYDNNYSHVRQPTANPRSSIAQQNVAGWSALDSQERVNQEDQPAQLPDDSPMPPNAKRKKSLRDSLYGHSVNVPKTRRQKKIAKAISLKDMNRSPLSAITEMTDSTEMPAIELPTEKTPRVTPERDGVLSPVQASTNWSLPINKKRAAPMSPVEIETPISLKREPSIKVEGELPRSASKQSDISEAPEGPLPPLPTFEIYKPNGGRRHSQMSTDTVSSSVLGPAMSSPSESQLPFDANSGMQDFDFGFTHRSTARMGPSPGRLTGWCNGTPGVASIVPSFDYQTRQWSTVSVNQPSTIREVEPESSDKWAPNAEFFFGAPRQVSNRHSMLDYSSSTRSQQIAKEQRQTAGNVSPASLPPRPASVASSNPYRSDSKPLFAGSRLSSGSAGSGRRTPGHRRQNCVRISIPVSTRQRRPSLISEIVEDSDDEAESSPNKVQIVDITKVSSVDRVRLHSRRSIVDENGSPTISPMSNRPVLNPSRPRRTASYASRNSPVSRPHSDVFYSVADPAVTESKPKTPDPFANPDRWALAPTPPSAVTLNPPMALHEDSPTLPSPIAPLKISSSTLTALPQMENSPTRKSRPMGPRSQPSVISTNVNLQSSKPVSKTVPSPRVSKALDPSQPIPGPQQTTITSPSDADLRKSVAMLRSMDSSGRHLNNSSRLYPGATSFMSSTSSRNNHDDWKELNAIWESRSNSVDSVSTRPITRDNSVAHNLNPAKRGHRQSLSQGNPLSSLTSPAISNTSALSRNNSIAAPGRSGYGMQQGSVSAGGGYLPRDSNLFGVGHNRQPSLFGSSKRKMSTSVSHSHNRSQASAGQNWSNTLASGNSTAESSSNLQQGTTWGQFGNISRAGSPARMSMMSISGMSIWEDESIRGDSPEPLTRQQSAASSAPSNAHLIRNNNTGPGPALPTSTSMTTSQNARPQQSPGLGISTTTTTTATSTNTSKFKPIIFDDAYSQAHLVSPLNDSDMENVTPTTHTFGGSRYTFNFPAVPTNNGKRAVSRGNLAAPISPIQQQPQQPNSAGTAKGTSTTQQSQFTPTTVASSTASSSTFASPSLQPQPLRSHATHPVVRELQQQQATIDEQMHKTPNKTQPMGLGLRVGDKLLGTPGSLRSLYDGEGFLKESPLRVGYGGGSQHAMGAVGGGGGRAVFGGGAENVSMRAQMLRGEGVGWQRR